MDEMMRRLSIGWRLTLSYLVVFAAAQFLFGFGMWLILRHNLYEITDDALAGQVDDVQRFLEAQKKDASVAKLQEEVTEAYVLEHSGDYLQISEAGGEWIYRASFLQKISFLPLAPDQLNHPAYEDKELSGKPFRFLSQSITVHGRRFTVQTGLPTHEALQTLVLFRRYLAMFAPLILLAASGLGYWVSGRALSPVDALTRSARAISGANLSSRLEQLHTGDELQRLSDTLNEMLSRIESAFLRVTQFTADASHELRTPISLIRTEAEIALRKSRAEPEYRTALRHILREAERTTALVEKLLSLARADSGREALEIRPFNLRETVSKAASEWRTVAGSKALYFREIITSDQVPVEGDESVLHQLLNILLDNAVKYTPTSGRIDLSLDKKDHTAVITVADSGIGIAEEDQPRIFERFYRADKARSREMGGAGLGLAIALWIVQQHRGSIAVQSSLGKGSAFIVELPLQPVAAKRCSEEIVPI
jgi:two-component system, OmpR family, heavy metal sensor histidine kinase CusS